MQITKVLKELRKIIELLDELRLDIVVEGKPPTCYVSVQKGNFNRICFLDIHHILTNIYIQSEFAIIYEDMKQNEMAELKSRLNCNLS